jgi:hypothetical protein
MYVVSFIFLIRLEWGWSAAPVGGVVGSDGTGVSGSGAGIITGPVDVTTGGGCTIGTMPGCAPSPF